MKKRTIFLILLIIIILIAILIIQNIVNTHNKENVSSNELLNISGENFPNNFSGNIIPENSNSGNNILENLESSEVQEDTNIANITPLVYDSIKAVYSTGWVAGSSSRRSQIINDINNSGFNAVVLDIKDEQGQLSYNSSVQTAIDIKASKNMIKDINSVINEFHENGIYVIGRIVTFKDPTYAKNINEIAYKKADGTNWTDRSGNLWPNPYNKDSWDYPIALAKEAAELGFDEIQFDYIRFPSSEGRVKEISYGFNSDTTSKSQIINEFLTTVMDELADYKVKVSADVFGIVTKRDGDFEKIGQNFKEIAKIVDIICPMVYPSHYGYGEYKISKPDLNPYGIVYGAVGDALKRVSGESETAEIRPYLQDFTASWLGKGNYKVYDTSAVADQIKACYDLGIKNFILWDPNNKYCFEALDFVQMSGDYLDSRR